MGVNTAWGIRGIYAEYSWGIHRIYVCIGYVSVMYRLCVGYATEETRSKKGGSRGEWVARGER